MNGDKKRWRNRVGLVDMPYTLLYPSNEVGLTGKGIPNSRSIMHKRSTLRKFWKSKRGAIEHEYD
ncbi:hypothetical protein LguiB_021051 [Lonicera macranthoides]